MTCTSPTRVELVRGLSDSCRRLGKPLKPVPPVESVGGVWWVANTVAWQKPQAEERLAHSFEAVGVNYFYPTRKVIEVTGTRRTPVVVERPEFPHYLFAAFDPSQEAAIKGEVKDFLWRNQRTQVYWLPVKDQATLVSQLTSLQKALADGDPIVGRMEGMRSGLGVRVVAGPLLGCEGVIDRTDAQKCRLWLNLNILGASRAVEIDPAYVEVIEP